MAKSNLYVVLANEKKLGDALIAYNAVARYFSKNQKKGLLLTRRNYALFTRSLPIKSFTYWGHLDRDIILLVVSFFFKLSIINISGESKSLLRIIKKVRPIYFSSRVRDYCYDSNGRKLIFNHFSNFEYTWGPLSFTTSQRMPICISEIDYQVRKGESYHLINPFSAERRRSLPLEAIGKIVDNIKKGDGSLKKSDIKILVQNSQEKSYLAEMLDETTKERCEIKLVIPLSKLARLIKHSRSVHTSDTGVYPLAVMLGVEVVVYYGPTQPDKADYCVDSHFITKRRLARLGNTHCDYKECESAECINELVGIERNYEYIGNCIARTD